MAHSTSFAFGAAALALLAFSSVAWAAEGAAPAPAPAEEKAAEASAEASEAAQIAELSEDLIYSVDRLPERPFETARAVQVITREDLARKNGVSLADVLLEEAGVFTTTPHPGGGSAIIRGLSGRQVLILVDGVKINNSIWRNATRSKEQLNLIDPSAIERVEIVRGVVSVLGTEALGGVVNIITRRGPDRDTPFAGTVGLRWASADRSFAAPVEIQGQTSKLRYTIGGVYFDAGDLRAGRDVGRQRFTDYSSSAAHLSLEYLATPEKTLSIGLGTFRQKDVKRDPEDYLEGDAIRDLISPIEMHTARLAYSDLTSRPWAQSFRAVAYWNKQKDGRDSIDADEPEERDVDLNVDSMYGLNLEFGTFLGSHHVLYGVDFSHEDVESIEQDIDFGVVETSRGRYLDGSSYRALGIYVNDRFDLGSRLTISAGARYGRFTTSGREVLPVIGEYDIGSVRSALTTSGSVIVHMTPRLNVIGSYIRGFRAPTIEDMTQVDIDDDEIELPATNLDAERVNSLEAGLKYDGTRFAASAFYFRNNFTGLVEDGGVGYMNGLPFVDHNGNGRDDGRSEQDLEQKVNFGEARLSGFELDFRFRPVRSLLVWGNFTRIYGQNEDNEDALELVQPRFAAAGVRVSLPGARQPWAELAGRYGSRVELGRRDIDAFHVLHLRLGAQLTSSVSATVALENLTNETYRFLSTSANSSVFAPGRQLLLSAQYKF